MTRQFWLNITLIFLNVVYVGRLSTGGTGFVIAISQQNLELSGRKVKGLVLTAAHCIANLFTGKFLRDNITACFSENGEGMTFKIIPLINFMKIDPQPSVSYSTGFQYCIENNIAICALIDNYNEQNFEEFQISPVIPPLNTECIISGYPDENTDIPYVYQNYCNETLSDLEIKLKHIFHDYEAQVNSHGLITNIGTNLIEVNCIATSGMSGSPVFLANSNYSLIGIYVGGPPLHGQYELMRIVKTLIDDQDVSKAYESLTNLKPTLPSVDQVHRVYKLGLDIILENLKSYLTNRQEILQSDLDIITNATINILYQLVIHSDELKCLNPSFQFNSVIPVSHPSFNRVGYAVDKFKQCAMNFNGPEELAYFLLN